MKRCKIPYTEAQSCHNGTQNKHDNTKKQKPNHRDTHKSRTVMRCERDDLQKDHRDNANETDAKQPERV